MPLSWALSVLCIGGVATVAALAGFLAVHYVHPQPNNKVHDAPAKVQTNTTLEVSQVATFTRSRPKAREQHTLDLTPESNATLRGITARSDASGVPHLLLRLSDGARTLVSLLQRGSTFATWARVYAMQPLNAEVGLVDLAPGNVDRMLAISGTNLEIWDWSGTELKLAGTVNTGVTVARAKFDSHDADHVWVLSSAGQLVDWNISNLQSASQSELVASLGKFFHQCGSSLIVVSTTGLTQLFAKTNGWHEETELDKSRALNGVGKIGDAYTSADGEHVFVEILNDDLATSKLYTHYAWTMNRWKESATLRAHPIGGLQAHMYARGNDCAIAWSSGGSVQLSRLVRPSDTVTAWESTGTDAKGSVIFGENWQMAGVSDMSVDMFRHLVFACSTDSLCGRGARLEVTAVPI